MSTGDLFARPRMSGVANPGGVCAVIFETTADVSVIKRRDTVDRTIFSGVRDAERFF